MDIKEIVNRRDELKDILLQYHKARMEDKGFDWFFVLSNRIDDLNEKIKTFTKL